MSFGKPSLQPKLKETLKDNAERKHAHRAEVVMLRVPSPETRLGEDMFLGAVEKTMIGSPMKCDGCKKPCQDTKAFLHGLCEECRKKFE
jgi:hypothetical protein